jgi:hypothetical protein
VQLEQEGPTTLLDRMKSYFKVQLGMGRFIARDHLAFKNLKTFKEFSQGAPDQTEDEKKETDMNDLREQH